MLVVYLATNLLLSWVVRIVDRRTGRRAVVPRRRRGRGRGAGGAGTDQGARVEATGFAVGLPSSTGESRH